MAASGPSRFRLCVATDADRPSIYRLRHDVFARELRQHGVNVEEQLVDPLDASNVYLLVKADDELVGHISVTPPGAHGYSIDKYVRREQLPFAVDDGTYEVRLLTVRDHHRGSPVALLLMLASLEWVAAIGGTRIMALGRREVLPFYQKAGLRTTGLQVQAGAVTFEVITATIEQLKVVAQNARRTLAERVRLSAEWDPDAIQPSASPPSPPTPDRYPPGSRTDVPTAEPLDS
ncbi:MAG: GNAT family N-acetyltransferase, partial [Gemmatimonas sp.]